MHHAVTPLKRPSKNAALTKSIFSSARASFIFFFRSVRSRSSETCAPSQIQVNYPLSPTNYGICDFLWCTHTHTTNSIKCPKASPSPVRFIVCFLFKKKPCWGVMTVIYHGRLDQPSCGYCAPLEIAHLPPRAGPFSMQIRLEDVDSKRLALRLTKANTLLKSPFSESSLFSVMLFQAGAQEPS